MTKVKQLTTQLEWQPAGIADHYAEGGSRDYAIHFTIVCELPEEYVAYVNSTIAGRYTAVELAKKRCQQCQDEFEAHGNRPK